MKLSNKTFGIIGMIGAPGLFLEMCNGSLFGSPASPWDGIFDLLYMVGWLCSIIGFINMKAVNDNKHSQRLLWLNVIFLCFACVWDTWEAIDPANQTMLYHILDCFWPASNLLLFITGIVIAVQGRLQGFARYAPLIAGSWLAFCIVFGLIAGNGDAGFYAAGVYSIIAWFLMGLCVYKNGQHTTEQYNESFSLAS